MGQIAQAFGKKNCQTCLTLSDHSRSIFPLSFPSSLIIWRGKHKTFAGLGEVTSSPLDQYQKGVGVSKRPASSSTGNQFSTVQLSTNSAV